MGRLVITHSTYIDGLIKWLTKLAQEDKIKTITPAIISRVKGRSPKLQLRISTKIRGGFKLIARKGNTSQEVFVITNLLDSEFRKVIERSKPT